MAKMECKNCGNRFEGNFCNQCGQNIRVDKLTLKNFFTELWESVFQVNHGLFFTIKTLFQRPGHAIREFLNGHRKVYFKPVAYALVLSTFYFFLTKIFGTSTFLNDVIAGFQGGAADKAEFDHNAVILEFSTKWLTDNFAYTNLFFIPLFSLASYIAFLGKGQNYLEHVVINSYMIGQQTLFYSSFVLIGTVTGLNDLVHTVDLFLVIAYRFWVYVEFYNNDRKMHVVLRVFLSYLILYFIFAVLVTILLFGTKLLK